MQNGSHERNFIQTNFLEWVDVYKPKRTKQVDNKKCFFFAKIMYSHIFLKVKAFGKIISECYFIECCLGSLFAGSDREACLKEIASA